MSEAISSNLIWSAILIFSLMYLLWLIHFLVRDASIVDLFWGAGFGLIALLLLWMVPERSSYHWLLSALPVLWSIRYTAFIFRRNFGKGEDDRYTALREYARKNHQSWLWVSFLKIYSFQGLAMWVVSAPLILGLAAPSQTSFSWNVVLGLLLWVAGFLFEAIADAQLTAFKKKHATYSGPYQNKPLLSAGLWKYSRHPNYFGNATMWWGIGFIALSAPWGWLGLIGPAFMHFSLVYLTGKANNEEKMIKRKAYKTYVETTSGFFPWWPRKAPPLERPD